MAAKPVTATTAPQLETLQNLARILSIPSDGDITTIQQRCFDRAVVLCRENIHWDLIQTNRSSLASITNVAGRSLLLYAIEIDEPTWVERLIHYKVGSLSKDARGNNALHLAAAKGAIHLFDNLVRVGIDQPNADGELPIHCAIKEGQDRAVEMLIGYHARLDIPITVDGIPLTALGFSVARGQNRCTDLLVQKGKCSLRQQVPNIGSLLHLAIHFKQPRQLRQLLRKYSEMREFLDTPNDQGLIPLAYAAKRGEIRAMRILIAAGASLDKADEQGRTALHHAALARQYGAVEALIYLGVKLNLEDHTHQTPLSILRGLQEEDADEYVQHIDLVLRSGEAFSLVKAGTPTFPTNGAFKGGGVKGTSYGGVAKAFAARHALGFFKRYAGTSAGSITAAILSLNYSASDVDHILLTKNFLDFLDHPFTEKNLKKAFGTSFGKTLKTLYTIFTTITDPVKLIDTLWHQTGLCKGEELRKWVEELIAKQVEVVTGKRIDYLTFGELDDLIQQGHPFKHLHVFTTRVGDKPAIVSLSSETRSPAMRNIIISDGVTCSASIPGVFEARNIYIKQGNDRVVWKEFGTFVDGGVLYNLPVETFDMKKYIQEEAAGDEGLFPVFNTQTVGFDLRSSGEIKKVSQVETVGELLGGLVNVYTHAESLIRGLNPYHKTRLVEIDIGQVTATDFCLTDAQKQVLIQSGFDAATRYLDRIPRDVEFGGIKLAYPLNPQDLHQHLCAALRGSKIALAEKFLSLGMDIDQFVDERGNTVVHTFAEKGNLEALKFLDDHGASLDKRNLDGLTPFHSAVIKGQVRSLDWLKGKVPSCLRQTTKDGKDGKTSMQLAVEKGKPDSLAWLLQHVPSTFDPSLLQVAIDSLQSDMIQKVIEQLNFPELDLSRKELGDQKTERVAQALESVVCVQILNLKRNNLGSRIGPALRSLLRANSHLVHLNLERNTIEGDGTLALAEGLKGHQSLQILNLLGNDIGDMGGLAIVQVLPSLSSLEELNLASNGLTDATIAALAEALRGNRSLKTLSLWGNLISFQAASLLLDSLKDNTTLKELYLHGSDAMTQQEYEALGKRKVNFKLKL